MKTKLLAPLAALCVSVLSAKAEPPVRMYIWAAVGPVRTANNVAESDAFLVNGVQSIYHSNRLDAALGHEFKVEYVANQATSSNVVWFFIRVVSANSVKFSPNLLVFSERSSDPGNLLGYTNSFANPNYVFAPRAMGVIYSGGPRIADNRLTSGTFQPVDEFIMAVQTPYWAYASDAFFTSVSNYFAGITNFVMTGTWSLLDASSNRVAVAHKSLGTGLLATPILADVSLVTGPVNAQIGINLETNRSVILQSKTHILDMWYDEATLNAGDIILRPMNWGPPGSGQKFYQAIIQ